MASAARAKALGWQESIGTQIVLATVDGELWEAGRQAGLLVWPEEPARKA